MRFGIGIAAVLAILALIIGGAFWAAKHPEDGKADNQPNDNSKQDVI